MGKTASLIVMTLLTMLLSGCGNDQGKTVINYCTALDAGKLDEAVSYLSRDAKLVLEKTGGKQLLAASGAAFKQHKGIKKIEITQKKITGERADVSFVYTFNDGSTFNDFFPLVKEDGKWKIAK